MHLDVFDQPGENYFFNNLLGMDNDWAGTLQSGLAGLSDGSVEGDWRLPTMSELEGITRGDEYIQYDQPHFFANVQSFFYWSSTACPGDIEHAWLVFMYCGCLDPGVKSYNYFVWPVRSGR